MDENAPETIAERRRWDVILLAGVNLVLLLAMLSALMALCHVFAPALITWIQKSLRL